MGKRLKNLWCLEQVKLQPRVFPLLKGDHVEVARLTILPKPKPY